MKIPGINLDEVQLLVRSIAARTRDSEIADAPPSDLEMSLAILSDQCAEAAWSADCQSNLNTSLDRIHALSRDLSAEDQTVLSQELDLQAFPLAIWAIRKGAVVEKLGPVVHAIAQLANQLTKPDDLQALYALVDEIYTAVAPDIRDDRGIQEAGRPWRVLLLNRAIIATRSLQPIEMASAFDSLVQYLPSDLNDFLKEGIRQLEVVGYPEPVRRIMESYYTLHGSPTTLH